MARDEWRQKRNPVVLRDHLLWEMVCRTVVPLHDKLDTFISESSASVGNKKKSVTQFFSFSQEMQQQSMIAKNKKSVSVQSDKIHFFDRVAHHKIAKGHYPIEARLDLHGCVQTEAYFFLKNFLRSSQHRGLRYVLVITGKGRSRGSDGVLREFVPRWLSTPNFRYYVHAFEKASHRHGGSGALYIRLRHFMLETKI
ncbi:Smr/MutS family protein [Bartonella sp. B41]